MDQMTLLLGGDPRTARVLGESGEDSVMAIAAKYLPTTDVARSIQVVAVPHPSDAAAVYHALFAADLLGRIGRIVTQDEFCVVPAAMLRELLGVSGQSLRSAVLCRDKAAQKSVLRSAGVATVDSRRLSGGRERVLSEIEEFGFPAVVKPAIDAATRGVRFVGDPRFGEVAAQLVEAEYLRSAALQMVERTQTGWEWHVDGFVDVSGLGRIVASRYVHPPIAIRGGHLTASAAYAESRHPELYETLRTFVSSALAALELERGVFHLELFEVDGVFSVGECASRIGGALTAEVYEQMSGLSLHREALRLEGGAKDDAPDGHFRDDSVGFALLGLPRGLVVSMPSEEDMGTWPGVVDVQLELEAGEWVPDLTQESSKKVGQVLVAADDEVLVAERLESTIARFSELSVMM